MTVGVIGKCWPNWAISFRHAAFTLEWILIVDTLWISLLRRVFPNVLILGTSAVNWDHLATVSLVGINGLTPTDGISPLHGASVFLFDSGIRESKAWKDWHFWSHKVLHSGVGGITSAECRFTLAIHNTSKSTFCLTDFSIPQYPQSYVAAIADCTIGGKEVSAPRLPTLSHPTVTILGKNLYHPNGLLPWKRFNALFPLKCVFAKSKWVIRKLTLNELYHACDIPVLLSQRFNASEGERILEQFTVPLKCNNAFVSSLFLNAKLCLNGGGITQYFCSS